MKIPFSIALIRAYHACNNIMRPRISALGLSVGQPKIMDFLTRNDGCMQKDLATLCHIEPATVSRLLGNMETSGLITRTVVAGNRRAVSVSLTALGRTRQKTMSGIRHEVETLALDGFTDEERAAFYDYLTRLYQNLSQEDFKGGER